MKFREKFVLALAAVSFIFVSLPLPVRAETNDVSGNAQEEAEAVEGVEMTEEADMVPDGLKDVRFEVERDSDGNAFLVATFKVQPDPAWYDVSHINLFCVFYLDGEPIDKPFYTSEKYIDKNIEGSVYETEGRWQLSQEGVYTLRGFAWGSDSSKPSYQAYYCNTVDFPSDRKAGKAIGWDSKYEETAPSEWRNHGFIVFHMLPEYLQNITFTVTEDDIIINYPDQTAPDDTTASDQTVPGANIPTGPDTWKAKSGVEGFVYRLYNVALLRDAEEAGLADWTNRLNTKTESAAQVARGFFFSQEFMNRNYTNEQYIEFLYRTMFGRDSDASGREYWLSCLEKGASREYVYRGFVESQEFTELCNGFGVERGSISLGQYRDRNIEATGFIARLYTKMLGRSFDDDGLEYWCKAYMTGEKSIENIAADGFLHSQELKNQNLDNKEFVTRMYETFLNREPEEAGLNDWIGRLERGEVTRDTLVYGFTNSPEFRNLKAEYNLP